MRYKFICEYNGFAFSGWQEQRKNGIICEKTVQTELENAFSIALRQKIGIVGAGRTDAGVHARGQVAHFDFTGTLDCKVLERSVNAISDKNVCIRNLEPCPKNFHARYSAQERYYTYTLCTEPVVLGKEIVWACRHKLNAELMEQEALNFLGLHDFSLFSIPRLDGKNTECNITEFRLEKCKSSIRWHIRANRFLHKQVRSMVGLLFDVGRGRYKPGAVNRVFSGEFKGERTWAPPEGLVLEGVFYLTSVFRFIFLFFLILLSCNKTETVDKSFALAYAELRVAEQEYGESEDGKIIRHHILQRNGLSAETFEQKIESIKKESENWISFQRIVVDILDSMSKAI